jgi:Tfp pilus assembly protein PilO
MAVLLLALGLFVAYHVRYSDKVERLADEVAALEGELEQTAQQRQELARMQRWRRQGDRQSELLLEARLGPRSRRLTQVLRQVKELAARSGIRPSSIRYNTEATPEEGVERVSWSYSVVGSYEQVRSFLHLLETTDDFLILEDVRLSQVDEQTAQLRIQLGLSTVFTIPRVARATRRGSR